MVADALNSLRAALPSGVELVAVSKFHPVSRLMEAYNAGQRIFAESRPQELASKVPQMPSDVCWHFIGHLQTNKLKLVLPYVSLVQSVDSLHLLEAINAWGVANGRVVNVLLELHLGAEDTKQGFTAEEIIEMTLRFASSLPQNTVPVTKQACSRTISPSDPSSAVRSDERSDAPLCHSERSEESPMTNVNIVGLMGMATNTEDMTVVERDFEKIERLFLQLKSVNPSITELSIGMSGDWPVAVRHQATMVRIGTDIFGPREY